MGKSKSVIGKKRNAPSSLQSKPSKKTAKLEKQAEVDNLFDNLDEEMDPAEMEKLVEQINEASDSESQADEEQIENEEIEMEEEEEYEPNEFDNINFDDDEEEQDEEEKPEEEEEEEEEEEVVEDDKMEEDQPTTEKQSTFRDLYMTKVTRAFGSDLDTIRQEPNFNGTRLNILIDSLEAGIDIFSNIEQEIILADEK